MIQNRNFITHHLIQIIAIEKGSNSGVFKKNSSKTLLKQDIGLVHVPSRPLTFA